MISVQWYIISHLQYRNSPGSVQKYKRNVTETIDLMTCFGNEAKHHKPLGFMLAGQVTKHDRPFFLLCEYLARCSKALEHLLKMRFVYQ